MDARKDLSPKQSWHVSKTVGVGWIFIITLMDSKESLLLILNMKLNFQKLKIYFIDKMTTTQLEATWKVLCKLTILSSFTDVSTFLGINEKASFSCSAWIRSEAWKTRNFWNASSYLGEEFKLKA